MQGLPEMYLSNTAGNSDMTGPVGGIKQGALLPPGYVPGNWDVICQRGKDCHEHIGNRRFRMCVENYVDSYVNAKTRQDKSAVISAVVRNINDNSAHTGGFVMKDPKTHRWYHVDNKVARDKVGNALRDAIKQKYGDSSESLKSYSKQNLPSTITPLAREVSSTMCLTNMQFGLPPNPVVPLGLNRGQNESPLMKLAMNQRNTLLNQQKMSMDCSYDTPQSIFNLQVDFMHHDSPGSSDPSLPTCGSMTSISELFDSDIFGSDLDLEPRPIRCNDM